MSLSSHGIQDPRSGIQRKPISDSGSRGQEGTGSRIRNTEYGTVGYNSLPWLTEYVVDWVGHHVVQED
jgi:hypothetical protein